jgi:hypothetical protein
MSRVQKTRAPLSDQVGMFRIEYVIIAVLALAVSIGFWKTFAQPYKDDRMDGGRTHEGSGAAKMANVTAR